MNQPELYSLICGKLRRHFGKEPDEATREQTYMACAFLVRDILMEKWVTTQEETEIEGAKQVYYLSMEFLIGRSLMNHLNNLGLTKDFEKTLKKLNYELSDIAEVERDAGLGNGGLGRLAACYQDAMATLAYPSWGFSILYEYGIFKQRIVDGMQVELPDKWLESGNVWLIPKIEETREVHFGGTVEETFENGQMKFVQRGYDTVLAVPNDMIISGYDSKAVSTLRLWSAKSPQNMDMNLFSQGQYVKAMEHQAMCEAISKVLYPEDAHPEGKSLRLKQQYFFVSATIQFIVAQHKERYGSLDGFAKHVAIHINDTHPTVAIPELMRILIDEEGYAWDDAWDVVTNSLAYTNHTVMAEALERWTASLFKRLLPRIYQIVEEINRRFCDALWRAFPGEWKHIGSLAIMSDDEVRMANLCVAACFSVNGVSALHSDILKNTVFKEFYGLYPGKFKNVTNGIAHRRWLKQANPELSSLICELIGDKFLKEPARLSELTKFANDNTVLDKLGKIKGHNKERLVKTMEMRNIENSIFDVQAKRMHEYKRQLLNVLHIMRDYHRILDGNTNIVPRTYVFAAKAAPGYYIAKQIIRFICSLESEIENCPAAAKLIQVKFLEDYSVTLAERLIPAAEVSEQISIAGKEASGTGNMKFMLNGALTVGTMDGANVEICEAVGQDNIYIFGLRSDEVARLEESKSYCPSKYYQDNMELRRIIDHMRDGIGVGALKASYGELVNSLLLSDTYMVFKDFDDYCRVQDIISEDYGNKREWNRKSLYNIANAGRFSADRSIKEYANGIWRIKPLENLR